VKEPVVVVVGAGGCGCYCWDVGVENMTSALAFGTFGTNQNKKNRFQEEQCNFRQKPSEDAFLIQQKDFFLASKGKEPEAPLRL